MDKLVTDPFFMQIDTRIMRQEDVVMLLRGLADRIESEGLEVNEHAEPFEYGVTVQHVMDQGPGKRREKDCVTWDYFSQDKLASAPACAAKNLGGRMDNSQSLDLVDIIDGILDVDDPRVMPLTEALGTAIKNDQDLGRTFGHAVGVRGSLRAAYWLARRDRAIREGAAMLDGVSGLVDVYTAWRAKGRPSLDPEAPEVMTLFMEIAQAEAEGCPLPGSDKGLRLAAERAICSQKAV